MSDQPGHNTKRKSMAEIFESVESSENPELSLLELIIERALQEDEELANAIRYCAIPRRFNAEIIGILRDTPNNYEVKERLLTSLHTYSFVLKREGVGYVYHDNTRELLLKQWQTDETKIEQFNLYNDRLVAYYKAKHIDAQKAEQNLENVASILREANESRYYQVTSIVEAGIISPLIEALYHKTLISAEAGFRLFEKYYLNYEKRLRLTVCESLLYISRGYLTRLQPKREQDVWLRWSQYYEGRLLRFSRKYPEAENVLIDLLSDTEDDIKLKMWIFSLLADSLQAQFKYNDAKKYYVDALTLSESNPEIDPWNKPVYYSKNASLHWSIDEWSEAADNYRKAIQSAQEQDNERSLAFSLLSLSNVLYWQGDWKESIDVALQAYHIACTEFTEDPALHSQIASSFMSLVAYHDPQLLDTTYIEAKALLPDMSAPIEKCNLQKIHFDLLVSSGQLSRAQSEQAELDLIANTYSETDFGTSLLFSQSLLLGALGLPLEEINIISTILERAKQGLASKWDYAASLSNRGINFAKLAEWSKAESNLTASINKWEEIGHLRLVAFLKVALAEVFFYKGDISQAQSILDEASKTLLKNNTNYVIAFHQIQGDIYRHQGRWSEAQEQYKNALDISLSMSLYKNAAQNLSELAKISGYKANWEEAAQYTRRALDLWEKLARAKAYQPDESSILADEENSQGKRLFCMPHADYERNEQVTQARDLFQSAIDRVPNNFWYYLNLMHSCAELEEWNTAAWAVESIIDKGPEWNRSEFLQKKLDEYKSKHTEQMQRQRKTSQSIRIKDLFSSLRGRI